MRHTLFSFCTAKFLHLFAAGLLGLGIAGTALADEPVNAKGAPNDFVSAVGNNALAAIKAEPAAKNGDLSKINQLVNQYVLPYVDLEKTTRLAAGRYWRQATPQQQKDLTEAFKGTLIRTYSGALSRVDNVSALTIAPFRGDANADDVVVRSTLSQRNGRPWAWTTAWKKPATAGKSTTSTSKASGSSRTTATSSPSRSARTASTGLSRR